MPIRVWSEAKNNFVETVDFKMTDLIQSIKIGDMDAFEAALVAEDVNVLDENECAPLWHAIACNQPEMALRLMDAHANVNGVDPLCGDSFLFMAITKGMSGTALALIDHGACVKSINVREADSTNAQCAAILGRQIDVLKHMLEKGANPNPTEFVWLSPLVVAALSEQPEVVEILKTHGADVNTRNEAGETELFDCQFPEQATALFRLGIDVNARDNNNETALFHWSRKLELLRQCDLDDDYLEHYLATRDIWDCILQNGADLSVQNNEHQTVFQIVRDKSILGRLRDFQVKASMVQPAQMNETLKQKMVENATARSLG